MPTSSLVIDVQGLRDLQDATDVACVDVRDRADYLLDHLPGAVNVPELYDYNASSTPAGEQDLRTTFEDVLGRVGLTGSERVVVYEDAMDSGHGRSGRAQVLLRHLGFPDARLLDGGLPAWRDLGLPLEAGDVTAAARGFVASTPPSSPVVTKAQVLAALDSPDVIRIDVRDQEEWDATANTPDGRDDSLRVGRLPDAKWLPWTDLLDFTGPVPRLGSAEQVRERCESATGAARDSPIQLYCYKGSRASCAYVALAEAGFSQVSVYLASWHEWGADPALPIESPQPAT